MNYLLQPPPLTPTPFCLVCFETGSLPLPWLTNLSSLAGQQAPQIFLTPPPNTGAVNVPSHIAFYMSVAIPTQVLMFVKQALSHLPGPAFHGAYKDTQEHRARGLLSFEGWAWRFTQTGSEGVHALEQNLFEVFLSHLSNAVKNLTLFSSSLLMLQFKAKVGEHLLSVDVALSSVPRTTKGVCVGTCLCVCAHACVSVSACCLSISKSPVLTSLVYIIYYFYLAFDLQLSTAIYFQWFLSVRGQFYGPFSLRSMLPLLVSPFEILLVAVPSARPSLHLVNVLMNRVHLCSYVMMLRRMWTTSPVQMHHLYNQYLSSSGVGLQSINYLPGDCRRMGATINIVSLPSNGSASTSRSGEVEGKSSIELGSQQGEVFSLRNRHILQ